MKVKKWYISTKELNVFNLKVFLLIQILDKPNPIELSILRLFYKVAKSSTKWTLTALIQIKWTLEKWSIISKLICNEGKTLIITYIDL